jgi:hypothetical protein
MNLIDAFILMTAISYLAAAILPYHLDKNNSYILQKIAYFTLCIIYIIALYLDNPYVWLILGSIYPFIALYCYAGGQDWGSTGHNLFMTAWDLALAVCLLSKVALP